MAMSMSWASEYINQQGSSSPYNQFRVYWKWDATKSGNQATITVQVQIYSECQYYEYPNHYGGSYSVNSSTNPPPYLYIGTRATSSSSSTYTQIASSTMPASFGRTKQYDVVVYDSGVSYWTLSATKTVTAKSDGSFDPIYFSVGVWQNSSFAYFPVNFEKIVTVNLDKNTAWRTVTPYVKVNGTWRQATVYTKVNGTWKKITPYWKSVG